MKLIEINDLMMTISSIHLMIKLDRDNYYYWHTILSNNEEQYTQICWWTLRQLMDRMIEWRCCDCNQLDQVIQCHNDQHGDGDTVQFNQDHTLLLSDSDDRIQMMKEYKPLLDSLQDKHCDISIQLIQQWIDCPWLLIQWSIRLLPHINMTQQLNDAMATLSTLGGAYSALGDQFDHFSFKAQLISFKQLYVAKMLGDRTLASKSKLYLALSLMQQGRLIQAERIIRRQFKFATYSPYCNDHKLLDICRACWSKLLYCKGIATHVDNQHYLDDNNSHVS